MALCGVFCAACVEVGKLVLEKIGLLLAQLDLLLQVLHVPCSKLDVLWIDLHCSLGALQVLLNKV